MHELSFIKVSSPSAEEKGGRGAAEQRERIPPAEQNSGSVRRRHMSYAVLTESVGVERERRVVFIPSVRLPSRPLTLTPHRQDYARRIFRPLE